MKEQYVTYEVSKLLKENGFDWFTYAYYTKDDVDEKPYFGMENLCPDNWNGEVDEVNDLWFSSPTQQMACRWLREEKGIFVDVKVYSGLPVQFGYDISVLYPDKTLVDKGGTFGFSSYEEATEKGLKYVLQNLSKYL